MGPGATSAHSRSANNVPVPQQGTPQRLRVLFLGDNGHHRPTQRAQQILPALARNGIDLFYTDDLDDLNDSELDRYQALVLYNNHLIVGDAQLASLMRFVNDGGGLVVLHCASASFQNSEEFIRLVGAAFKSHGTGTFSAVRVAGDHPAIAGVPVIESWDETYVHTKHNPVNRTVLEVRRENGHDEPWTWVRTYGKGRVFYTAWGHDQRTWGNQAFQQLVGQGIRWTVGDWALTQIARDPEAPQVKLDVPLPTYKRPPAPWNVLDTAITTAQAALSTVESLKLMTLRPHFRAEPFATEPMIGNIIDFTWDARGRMWAVETNDYPNTVLPDSGDEPCLRERRTHRRSGAAHAVLQGHERRRQGGRAHGSLYGLAAHRHTRCHQQPSLWLRQPGVGIGRLQWVPRHRRQRHLRARAVRRGLLPLPDRHQHAGIRGAHEQQHVGRRVHRRRIRLWLDGEQPAEQLRAHSDSLLSRHR